MKKLNVAVIGAGGRMGQEIGKILVSSREMTPKLGVISSSKNENFFKNTTQLKKEEFKGIDVVIDFSLPENFSKTVKFCSENKLPLVSGVTGISKSQKEELKIAGKSIPVLWAPNMSVGVATLKKALHVFKAIKDFDFQVLEFHHNKKKDNPGGTALMLQEELEKIVGKKAPPAFGVRGGGIYGIHQVFAMSQEEVITFEHQVLSRSVFAAGAVKAANWIVGKKAGLYSMEDCI